MWCRFDLLEILTILNPYEGFESKLNAENQCLIEGFESKGIAEQQYFDWKLVLAFLVLESEKIEDFEWK